MYSAICAIRCAAVILMLCLTVLVSIAQPPAQGPRPTDANANELSYLLLLAGFEAAAQSAIDAANAHIAQTADQSGIEATVGFSYEAFPPYMTQTTYTDQPNQNQVRMSLMATYTISGIKWHGIPYFSRTASQSIDIYSICKTWYSDTGKVHVDFVGQQPFLDGNSFGEDALNFFVADLLSNYVDKEIRKQLVGFANSADFDQAKCNCLGVSVSADKDNHYKGSSVNYQYVRPVIDINTTSSANASETIKVLSVKRLPAHDASGGVLYDPQEDVDLELYVNQNVKTFHLGSMSENQVVNPDNMSFVFPKPDGNALVVVIANIVQNNHNLSKDSRFSVYTRANNFGNGTQTIDVSKAYWRQPIRLPHGGMSKPIKVLVNAYEIMLSVKYPIIQNE